MTTKDSDSSHRAAHWDTVYGARSPERTSWYQREPQTSLELVEALGILPGSAIIDVGGGASTFVDQLLKRGFCDVTVLDVSAVALDVAENRVGANASVRWLLADVLTWSPMQQYQLWHDRAVFHFLVDPADRSNYLSTLRAATPDGSVILAAFARDGPDSCSGLPVARYDPDDLAGLLTGFDIVEARRDIHITPTGDAQPFTFVAARRIATGPAEG